MDWQPIETAPKKSGTILLLTDGREVAPAEVWDDGSAFGYYDLTTWAHSGNDDVSFDPTHWMRLPEPPSE